jgi:hypothetical protein
VYNGSAVNGTTATVTGIPTNGVNLYVRLYYGLNGAWPHTDYVVTEAGTSIAPSLTSPTPGSTLSSATNFTWNPGAGSTAFMLKVGTTGTGSTNIYSGSASPANSVQVTGLPASGTIYVRLYYQMNGSYSFRDYTYQ